MCVRHCDELDKDDDTGDNVNEPLNDLCDGRRVFRGFVELVVNVFDGVCYFLLLGFNDCRAGDLCGSGHSGRLGSVTNVKRIQGV